MINYSPPSVEYAIIEISLKLLQSMSKTLYRTYRPGKFSDVFGQEHIVKTLTNAIKNNRIGHAYLFTGPRGTGKTTIARLLATSVNCDKRKDFTQPDKTICERLQDGSSLDVIEIDAASHTGVDNIRELNETIVLPPTETPFKVYIIDEVHMLSTGAFNALLKTLEEPPAHAIFILATTEIHKVPETIISRCQRFDFTRLTITQITDKLAYIAKSEKVDVEKEALEMIAIAAEGGMRDAESLLAQVIALEDKKVTAKEVASILGTAEHAKALAMIDFLAERNTEGAIRLVNELSDQGYDLTIFGKELITKLRATLFLTINKDLSDVLSYELSSDEQKHLLSAGTKTSPKFLVRAIEEFTRAVQKVRGAAIPQLPLEIAIVTLCYDKEQTNSPPPTNSEQELRSTESTKVESSTPQKTVIQSSEERPSPVLSESSTIMSPSLEKIIQKWDQCIAKVKEKNSSLAALVATAELTEFTDDKLVLSVPYSFHQEKLLDGDNKLTIEKALGTICGLNIRIDAIIKEKEKKEKAGPGPSELINQAMHMMGGQVVES